MSWGRNLADTRAWGLRKFHGALSAGAVVLRLYGIGAKGEISMAQNPQVKGGAVPYLTVDGAVRAAEFYKKAFAAEIAIVHPPDQKGRTMHAHLYINGSSLMMSDAYPEHGHPLKEPAAFNIMLPVQDVDAWYNRAVEAGCTAVMPPADMFWGDRYGQVKDPFGVTWAINGPVKK
jgi:PhnB protein